MKMFPRLVAESVAVMGLAALLTGCASIPEDRPASFGEAERPAWSLKVWPNEMIVSVSPAGGALSWAGSSGALLGAGVDAVVNDRYRQKIKKALEGYDTLDVLKERIHAGVCEAAGREVKEIAPLGSTAGLSTRKEAEDLRYERVAKNGADVLLDLTVSYGVFGYQGALAVQIEGEVNLVPEGIELWDDAVAVTTDPILASEKLRAPKKQLGPSTSFQLTVDEEAMNQWTADGGAELKRRFEAAVDAAVSTVLCDIGLAEEAVGEYHLGKRAIGRGEYQRAEDHFVKALLLDAELHDAFNGRTVNVARSGDVDKAIEMAEELTESIPDYGPAWYNLAWWYAVEKEDAAAALPCYRKALAFGMPHHEKIEKVLRNAE